MCDSELLRKLCLFNCSNSIEAKTCIFGENDGLLSCPLSDDNIVWHVDEDGSEDYCLSQLHRDSHTTWNPSLKSGSSTYVSHVRIFSFSEASVYSILPFSRFGNSLFILFFFPFIFIFQYFIEIKVASGFTGSHVKKCIYIR